MPLTSSAADVLGVATLVLVLLLICAGLGCIAYVLYFRRRIQKERQPALQDFNALWIVRIILIVLAVLWSLVELLRLPLLRQPNWIFHSWSFRAQANVCRFYLLSSLGFLEPCFFLTALFLVHGSLRKAPFTPRRAWNGKVVVLILLCCLPVFLFQLFFVVISPSIGFKKSGGVYNLENEGYGGKVPYYFTQAFVNVTIDSREVAVCCYPFLSTLVLASFGILYSAYFLLLGWRVVRVVINRYLQRRLYGLLGALLLLLPLHVLFLGLSVLSKPTHVSFELLSFFAFIMVLLCTTVGEGILVIRPIADALAVGWVVYAASESGRDTDGAPGEGLISLSVFGSDDDEASLVGSRALFAKSQSRNRSRDAEDSEFGSARRSFLRPTGSFSDHNGVPYFNPDSPALPGKPLIAHHHHQNQQPFYPFL